MVHARLHATSSGSTSSSGPHAAAKQQEQHIQALQCIALYEWQQYQRHQQHRGSSSSSSSNRMVLVCHNMPNTPSCLLCGYAGPARAPSAPTPPALPVALLLLSPPPTSSLHTPRICCAPSQFAWNEEIKDWYAAYNKPGAVVDWLKHVDPKEEYIVVLDSDMLLRRHFKVGCWV